MAFQFKTGDRVRYTGKYEIHQRNLIGKVGTVIEPWFNKQMIVKFDGYLDDKAPFLGNLELYEEELKYDPEQQPDQEDDL